MTLTKRSILALKVLNSTYYNRHRLYFVLQIFHSQKHALNGYGHFAECFVSHGWCHGWTLHLLKTCHTHWFVFKLHLNCITWHGVDLHITNRKYDHICTMKDGNYSWACSRRGQRRSLWPLTDFFILFHVAGIIFSLVWNKTQKSV